MHGSAGKEGGGGDIQKGWATRREGEIRQGGKEEVGGGGVSGRVGVLERERERARERKRERVCVCIHVCTK